MIALPPPRPLTYQFADLKLDVSTRQLVRRGETIKLGGLTFDLLRALAEHAPAALSRKDLIECVWRGRYVSAETLIQRVKLLRQGLSDEASAPRYVESVRGYGYRLVPAVYPVDRGVKPALAVLPFDVLSRKPNSDSLAAGIHEEIVSRMASLPTLSVLARAAVKRYALSSQPIHRIATALGANVVMGGSVRYADDRVRVTAQLIDGISGIHLWAGVYECLDGDEFEIQSYVAHEIARAFEDAACVV